MKVASHKLLITLGCLLFALLLLPAIGGSYSVLVHQFHYSWRGWDSMLKDGRIIITGISERGPATALRVGDEIVALKTDSPEKAKMPVVVTDFWPVQAGTKYSLVIRRAGQEQEIALQTRPFNPTAAWLTRGIVMPLIRLFFLLTGLVVFLLRPADKQAWLLALMLGTLAALIPIDTNHLSLQFLRLVSLAQLVAFFFLPVSVHFFLVFPERSPLLRRFPRLVLWLYAVFCLLTLPGFGLRILRGVLLLGQSLIWLSRQPALQLASRLTTLAFMVATLAALIINYRAVGTEARRKLHVIVLGSGLGLINIFLLPAGEFLRLTPRFPTLWGWFDAALPLTLPLIPLSFAYAIIRHKVIPVSLIIRRGVRYVLVSRGAAILLMAVVWIVVTIILTALFQRLRPPGIVIGVISAAVGVIVWNAASRFHQRHLAPVIDRAFFRQAYDAQQMLAELAQSLRTTNSLPQLLEQVATKIQSALQTENVTVFLREERSGDYRSAYACEYNPANRCAIASTSETRLPQTGKVVEKLARKGAPLEIELNGSDEEFGEAERETLQQIKTNLLLPLVARDELLGIISLGPRLGDLPYSSEDEQLLMTVAGPATFAIENARLVERMIEEARQRQGLQMENERRAKELEEARQLQLSLLPQSVPQLPHMEIAAYMKTATEVGGDYYDFYLAEDGTLTVAIGDATGHGLRAGTMVTAAKSIFETLAHHSDLTHILQRVNRTLRRLKLRSLFMALAMVKVNGRQLTVSSAGMPPVLIYRVASGEVEEIMLRGMPLGSVADYPYQQREWTISPGDVVVLLSDGLPERFNMAGEMFDYERTKCALAEAVSYSPQQIIEHLATSGDAWAEGRPQDDDITFVVLKLKETSAAA